MTTAVTQETETAPVVKLGDRPICAPEVDLYDREDAFVLLADMPGVDEKHVEVTLENDVLTLRGRADLHEVEGRTLLCGEYVAGDYERSFTLSNEIDRERITAQMRNGVLTLVLPKATRAVPRQITVETPA
jgi:HSP20 family protein